MYDQFDAQLAERARALTKSKVLERRLVDELARELAGGGEVEPHHAFEALNTVSATRKFLIAEMLASLGVQPSRAAESVVVIREHHAHAVSVACLRL